MAAETPDPHTLAGAYALDAVTDADRAMFEQHLAGCESCREEIRTLREATARLAMVSAVQPRADLRDETLRAVARLSQLPPAGTEARRAAAAGDEVVTDGAAGQAAAASAAVPGTGQHAARPAVARPASRPWRRRLTGPLPRLALALSCVLAAVVVVLALMMHGAQHRLDQAQLRSHAIARVLTSADVTMLTGQASTGGTATVVMSHRQRALVFTAQGLPLPRGGHRYELWLMGPAGVRPAGMLPAGPGGMVGPVVVQGLSAGDRVGMTVEPAGGSARPSSAMVVVLGVGGG
jgi:hypothetical protein